MRHISLILEQKERAKGKNTIDLRADRVHQLYFNDPDGYEIEVNDRKD
jgi:hypothetical protein